MPFVLFILEAGQLPQFLRFENHHNNCWFNATMQMLVASGKIVDTFRRSDGIDVDLMPMSVIVITSVIQRLIKKQEKENAPQDWTIVKSTYIVDQINYLRAAGIGIQGGRQNCLLDFFDAAIVPTLSYHEIEFKLMMEVNLECSSCMQVSRIDEHRWNYLLVPQISSEDNLENVIVDIFGPTLQKKTCPKCSDGADHQTSLSLATCPRNLFLRFDPIIATGNKRVNLMRHINLAKIVSQRIIRTSSYGSYTLQSFIIFNGGDDKGHFVTFTQKKGEWYRLNDLNISLVQSSSLFDNPDHSQPVLLAHYIRPLDDDIFSIALWNVFTDFSPLDQTPPPSLSLNDAVMFFGRSGLVKDNPLNLVVIKYLTCPRCKKGMST